LPQQHGLRCVVFLKRRADNHTRQRFPVCVVDGALYAREVEQLHFAGTALGNVEREDGALVLGRMLDQSDDAAGAR
jgi:hypothetical protein